MAHTIRVRGIDIATLVFHVVGMDDSGHVILRKRLARSAWLTFIANLPPVGPENPNQLKVSAFDAARLACRAVGCCGHAAHNGAL
jgi:hypothetical protein